MPERQGAARRLQQALVAGSSLLVLLLLQPCQAQAPCLITGYPAGPLWNDAEATCVEYYPAPGAPIQFNDTATVKYGQIVLKTASPVTSFFVDRDNNTYGFASSAPAPTNLDELTKIWPNLIVRANVSGTNVVGYTPALFVPYRTFLAVYLNTTFEGTLTNSAPLPDGVSNTTWFRWTWGDDVNVKNETDSYQNFVNGTFDNLFKSVKDSKGTCRPALCSGDGSDQAACQFYTSNFGNTTNNLTLQWDPNFASPTDTRLVPIVVGKAKKYTDKFYFLWQLLKPYKFYPRNYSFIANSTLTGIPLNFTGTLVNGTTPLSFC